ncbi:hypothetical protein [Alistipes onderdonkii]|uniref:hypothetical protein n=1 Tax=Alistipes onderdonkii TaxID=328813 RepID=UPI001141A9A3|nr:hypothetical protein [Alistipes onderdonkii]
MLRLIEDPDKSALCIGHISQGRYEAMKSAPDVWHRYRCRFGSLFRDLAAEGIDTYLYSSWDFFDIVSADVLQKIKSDLIANFGCRYVYSMGVFETSRPILQTPLCTDYFDEIIVPQQDDSRLTRNILFRDLLSNVSTVVYDNAEHDPFVQSVLDHARQRNKRLLEV